MKHKKKEERDELPNLVSVLYFYSSQKEIGIYVVASIRCHSHLCQQQYPASDNYIHCPGIF